jgi:hypothetical protein
MSTAPGMPVKQHSPHLASIDDHAPNLVTYNHRSLMDPQSKDAFCKVMQTLSKFLAIIYLTQNILQLGSDALRADEFAEGADLPFC